VVASQAAQHFAGRIAQNLASWLIVLFLIPVTLMLQQVLDCYRSMMAQIQMILFMKNVSHARRRLADFPLRRGAVQPGCAAVALNPLMKGENKKMNSHLNRRILVNQNADLEGRRFDQLFAKRGPTQHGSPSQCRLDCSTRLTN